MVSDIKALQEWASNETNHLAEEMALTQSRFENLNRNLSAEANSVGEIQDKIFELDKAMLSFQNKAQNLSNRLEALKKKIHS